MDIQRNQSNADYAFIKYIPFMLIAFLVVLNVLPFLAPLLAHYGYDRPAKAIYWVYSFMCHQKAHRSLHIYDHQCAWCIRDTFIWSAMLVVALLVFTGKKRTSGISFKVALILGLPMAFDGSIQLVATMMSLFNHATPFYESTNALRSLTGTFFGTAVSMYLFPRLKNELDESKVES